MGCLNKYKELLITSLLLIALLSCKKEEMHTSFYLESDTELREEDNNKIQSIATTLSAYKFLNFPSPDALINNDGSSNELIWKRAERSLDFQPINGASAIGNNNRTQIRALYDANSLYLSIYCWDQSITYSSLSSGQDLRNSGDVVSIFLDPDGNGVNTYCIQVTPASWKSSIIVYQNTTSNAIATATAGFIQTSSYDNRNNFDPRFRNNWGAEIKINFTSADGFLPPSSNPVWRLNAIRENYDSVGGSIAFKGKYAWQNPSTLLEHNYTKFGTLKFSNTDISTATTPVKLRGIVMSSGPVNLSDYGIIGIVKSYPYTAANTKPFTISLGKMVNPGAISATYNAKFGDQIQYIAYTINASQDTIKSPTTRSVVIR